MKCDTGPPNRIQDTMDISSIKHLTDERLKSSGTPVNDGHRFYFYSVRSNDPDSVFEWRDMLAFGDRIKSLSIRYSE